MRKLFLFLFFLTVLVLPVSAVKPVSEAQFSVNTDGLQVEFPKFLNHQRGVPMVLGFHVYNSSNGVPIVEGVSCDLRVYNSSGGRVFLGTQTAVVGGYDYEFSLSGDNFSSIEQMSYVVNCNDSLSGGFASVPFDVNASGQNQDEMYFMILLFLIPILIGVFSLIGSHILGEGHDAFKTGLFLFSLTCFFASLWLSHIIVATLYPAFEELIDFIAYLTWVYALILAVIIYYFLMHAFKVMIHAAAQKDELGR